MLTGSSTAATLRARISAPVSRMPPKSPPSSMVPGPLRFVSSRAPWGASSPTKLISPERLTTQDTASVAVSSTAKRIRPTETPSIRASPSSAESRSTCRCRRNSAATQRAHSARLPPMEYPLTAFRLPMIQYSMEASSRSGSAVSFRHIRAVCASECTAMPASTMVLCRPERSSADSASASPTAASAPRKGGRRDRRRAGQKQDARRRARAGPGGNADHIGRGQRVAEHRLVDKARHAQRKASQNAHRRPAGPQRPEHPQLHFVAGQHTLQRERGTCR